MKCQAWRMSFMEIVLPSCHQARLQCCFDLAYTARHRGGRAPPGCPGQCSLSPVHASGQKEAPRAEDRKW